MRLTVGCSLDAGFVLDEGSVVDLVGIFQAAGEARITLVPLP